MWYIFWIIFAIMFFFIVMLDWQWNILRDDSALNPGGPRSFSLARAQLAWWTLIIIPSFATVVIITGSIPSLDQTLLILLGITGGTAAISRAVDGTSTTTPSSQPAPSTPPNLFTDMISDGQGAGIHRLQALAFNLIFGIWFIYELLHGLPEHFKAQDSLEAAKLLPKIPQQSLTLLGISAAVYASIKTTESTHTKPASENTSCKPVDNTSTKPTDNTTNKPADNQ